MNKHPDITLCVLTYKRSQDLGNVVKSYLRQEYKNSEMVIIDDASPDDTEKVAKDLVKKDKRIRYIRNKKNIGLSSNFKQAFAYCKGKYIIFLGDDDIFVDNRAVGEYVKVFEKYRVGVVRARQVIFRNWKLFQAAEIENNGKVQLYKRGKEAFESFIFDTTSIAGLAFVNSKELRTFLVDDLTMYPQFELAAKLCLIYNGAQINKYYIGVQSHAGQLNVLSYKLEKKRTNILDDMAEVYDRISFLAKKHKIQLYSKNVFMNKIIAFMPLFLPYNTLKNGKKDTLSFIKRMASFDKLIFLNRLFWVSALMVSIFPNFMLRILLDKLSDMRLRKLVPEDMQMSLNGLLANYS